MKETVSGLLSAVLLGVLLFAATFGAIAYEDEIREFTISIF